MSEATTSTRRVHFAETNQIQEFESFEHLQELWVSKELCHRNKERCQRSGRQWNRKGYDVLLLDIYEKPALGTQSKINAFVAIDEEADCVPRGIERFISATHADERRFAKIHCIEAIVDLYTYMRRQNKTLQEIEGDLYDLSLKQSKRSRDFARRLAHADARWVREQQPRRVIVVEVPTGEDDEVSVMSSARTVVSMSSTASKVRKGFSSRALVGTRKLTRLITGNRSNQTQR